MKKKLVVIINGAGGVGKDTLCEYVKEHIPTKIVSSVDPIKNIARIGGWDGTKDDKGRLLLVRLKQAFVEFNDLPLKYLCEEYNQFLLGDNQVLFTHIREPQEIEKFKNCIKEGICKTILVTRDSGMKWNNSSDLGVNGYEYDYYYDNNLSLNESCEKFLKLISSIIE